MKIAIVHDYLITNGGAERCLRELLDVFPEADLYSLFCFKERFPDLHKRLTKTSFLDKIPFLKRRHDIFLPFYTLATESLRIENYDVVIASGWAWAKNITVHENTCCICYCHGILRFVYSERNDRLKNLPFFIQWPLRPYLEYIKQWDLQRTKGVTYFIANSSNTQQRLAAIYNRQSFVIPPPVDADFFRPLAGENKAGYYLVSARLVPYKKIDVVVEAFNKLQAPLKIAGDGIEAQRLKAMASDNIEFLGHIADQQVLRRLYCNCRALIFPQEEDWGISALEAQSCGRPVLAYARGGALESVIEGKTGHFFYQQTPEAIIAAIKEFEGMDFDSAAIRENALQYDREIFKAKIKAFVQEKYNEFKKARWL